MNLIISANVRDSQLVAFAVGLGSNRCRHVRNVFDLMGYASDTRIYLYDTTAWRRDYDDIAAALERFDRDAVIPIDEWFCGGPTAEERVLASQRGSFHADT